MFSNSQIQIFALPEIRQVKPGDNLTIIIEAGLNAANENLVAGDVVVIAQKIVSKAQNRYVDLKSVMPSVPAKELAIETQKDPRLVELILSESSQVVKYRPNVLIVEHRLGMVMANAGIDASNVEPDEGKELVLLLPKDPNGDCLRIRKTLRENQGVDVAVIINDSVGRAWRKGTVGIALGSAGLSPVWDLRGNPDLFGRSLEVSETGLADEIAAAASLIQGQGNEGTPIVIVRGLKYPDNGLDASSVIRPAEEDLFR